MSTSNSGQSGGGGSGSTAPGGIMVLDAPTVVRLLPGNVLPAQFNDSDLEVEIRNEWPIRPPGMKQYVVFVWHVQGGSIVDVPESIIEVLDTTPFPLTTTIPVAYLLSSAIVDLSYRVHNLSPTSPTFEPSSVETFRIDREAPGRGLLAPAIYPFNPITDPLLITSPWVRMEIPGNYSGREALDQVLLYFLAMNALPTGGPTQISPPLAATGPIYVDVPATVFRSFPGATRIFCFYRLKDYAGNLNPQFSLVAEADLQLSGPPEIYPAPEFPQSKPHPNSFMTCTAFPPLWDEVEVCVGHDSAFKDGDLITMRFQGYAKYPDRVPISDTAITLTHIWDGVVDSGGYCFKILNVERVIRPLKEYAGGRACYVVSRNGITLGMSKSRYVIFDRLVITTQPPTLYCWRGGNVPEP